MANPNIPDSIVEFSKRLPKGFIVPHPVTSNGKEIVGLIGHETDDAINSIGQDPVIEMGVGVFPFLDEDRVVLAWIFIKFVGKEEEVYEIGLNLADPQHLGDLLTLSMQEEYEIIMCGETIHTAIKVSALKCPINKDILCLLENAKEFSSLSWGNEKFQEKLGMIHDQTGGPADLFRIMKKSSDDITGLFNEFVELQKEEGQR